jgi:hypothetical protein
MASIASEAKAIALPPSPKVIDFRVMVACAMFAASGCACVALAVAPGVDAVAPFDCL